MQCNFNIKFNYIQIFSTSHILRTFQQPLKGGYTILYTNAIHILWCLPFCVSQRYAGWRLCGVFHTWPGTFWLFLSIATSLTLFQRLGYLGLHVGRARVHIYIFGFPTFSCDHVYTIVPIKNSSVLIDKLCKEEILFTWSLFCIIFWHILGAWVGEIHSHNLCFSKRLIF